MSMCDSLSSEYLADQRGDIEQRSGNKTEDHALPGPGIALCLSTVEHGGQHKQEHSSGTRRAEDRVQANRFWKWIFNSGEEADIDKVLHGPRR
jgi:hypothetical protein